MRRGKFVQKTQTTAFLGMREDSYAQSIKYVTVKLCNAPAQARDGCARGGRDHANGTGPDDGALYGLDGPHLAPLPLVPPPLDAFSV